MSEHKFTIDPNTCPDIHSSSPGYEKRFAGASGRFLLEVQSAIIAKRLALHTPSTLIDVGGGHNQVCQIALSQGYKVTVQGTNEVCKRLILEQVANGEVSFLLSSLDQIPVKNRNFEVVSALRMLTHFTDWKSLVSELCRVADSTVIIEFPPMRSFNLLYPLLFNLKRKIEKNTRTFRIFARGELENEFAKHGFVPVFSQSQFFLPVVLHRIIGNIKISTFLENICSRIGLTKYFGAPIVAEFVRIEFCLQQIERLF